jgi:3-dehydroquinate synthase
MVERTTVSLPALPHSYPIEIGAGLLAQLGTFVRKQLPQATRAFVITDSAVGPLYLPEAVKQLEAGGFVVSSETIPPGESSKSLEMLSHLYRRAIELGLKRNDAVIALGGGIVGDLTGYFSATYQRGVAFIQVPTTLLAQVDSSIGGKVAINWDRLKNFVGCFYHPHGVLIDTQTLSTLPAREFCCGMAEVIKYSLLERSVPGYPPPDSFFSFLKAHNPTTLKTVLPSVILRCCTIKAAVVAADPEERHGIRELLNLGHTFAHAYETLSDGAIPHGEAVGMGIYKAFQVAALFQSVSNEDVLAIKSLLEAYHLPLEPFEPYPAEAVLDVMRRDKKANDDASLRLVLPTGSIGHATVQTRIKPAEILPVLE